VAPLGSRSVHLHPYRGFYAAGTRELGDSRSLLGKPVIWTAGWGVVLGVLLVTGVLLLSVRLEMGSLSARSPKESQAVHRVLDFKPAGAQSVSELIAVHAGPHAGRWYAIDRSWEHRIYVVWQWRDVVLSFTVHGARVTPDKSTRAMLGMDTPSASGQAGSSGVAQP
jgi:hypothetical protein